ncbi:MAG TPA: adenylate/guanylate cyclase domain-containing protein [Candidatus Cloacimonadota bacterium]|nr:adenylate/guanylate cyclase domain-containing protein [Candidatus Cloacimonadota bacterium]
MKNIRFIFSLMIIILIFLISTNQLYSQNSKYSEFTKNLPYLKSNEQISEIVRYAQKSMKSDTIIFHSLTKLLKQKAEKEHNLIAECYYLCLLSEFYLDNNKVDLADKHINMTEAYISKISNMSLLSKIFEIKGDIQKKLNNLKKAIEYYDNSLSYAKKIQNMKVIGDLYAKISICNMDSGDYDKALNYSKLSLKIRLSKNNKTDIIQSYSTIGNILMKKSDFQNSLENHFKAMKYAEAEKDSIWLSNIFNNIGAVYNALNETSKALEYYLKGISYRNTNDPDAYRLASSYNNIAIIYRKLKDYNQALYYFKKSLDIKLKYKDTAGAASTHNNIALVYISIEQYNLAKKHLNEAYSIYNKMGNKMGLTSSLSNFAYLYKSQGKYDLALDYAHKARLLAIETRNKQHALINYGTIVRLYQLKGDYKQAFKYFESYFDYKDSLYNVELSSRISEIQTKYDTEKKENENIMLRKDKQINELKLVKSTYWRNFLIISLILALIISALITVLYRNQKQTNHVIQAEKNKTDQLMLNILPLEIAKELKEKGKTTPQSFDNVTVMFSDLVNFTQITSILDPEVVINELNDLFTNFDHIMEKYNCERIKTIGDAYLAVCGMPEENPDHAQNIVQAALDMIHYIQNRNINHTIKWSIRIGIHTGRVVGGVVGIKKYIYDIFGDTINTTSRIENNSLPMQINISETTYQLVKNNFNFTQEQLFEIKGKGVIKTYCLYTGE